MSHAVEGRRGTGADHAEARPAACRLTERGLRLLEKAVAINGGMETPVGWSVAEKMREMELCEVLPPDYVGLGRQVTFSVDGRAPLSRVLVHWDRFRAPGFHLSLHTPWGIALFGMRVGSEAHVYSRAGVKETLRVEAVAQRASQPGAPAQRVHAAPASGRRRAGAGARPGGDAAVHLAGLPPA
jgi:hypothetical protein